MAQKFFQVERILRESDDKSAYGFLSRLDKDSIGKAISDSSSTMPNFCLSKVEIHLSGCCNLKCKFCYGERLAPKKRGVISFKKIKDILEDIRTNLPSEDPLIILSGLYSDPLIHPDIVKVVRLLGKHKYRFGIYTNGLLMNTSLMNALVASARASKSPKPSYISFNVSASMLCYKFKELLRIINTLSDKNRKFCDRLEINTPIIVPKNSFNYNLIFNVIKELDLAGVDNIRLSLPWIKYDQNKIERYVSLTKTDYKKSMNFFREMELNFKKIRVRYPQSLSKFQKCIAMSMSFSISPEGDVFPCPEKCSPLFKKEFSFGNVYENKISEIWRGMRHIKIFSGLSPQRSRCLCCPVNEEFNCLY